MSLPWENGLEEGNFSAWTATEGSPTVESLSPHHGTYHARYNPVAWATTCCNKNLTADTVIFVRHYFRLGLLPASGQYVDIDRLRNTGFNLICKLRIYNSAGTYQLRLVRYFPSGTDTYNLASLSADTYYCVEFKFLKGTSGEYRAWWQGSEVITTTGVDSSGAGTLGIVSAGIHEHNYNYPDLRIDCVKVATTYIGLEAAETQISVSDTATGSEAVGKLRNVAAILDSLLGAESILMAKAFTISDSGLGAEVISRPERQMTITDLANGLENLFKLREVAPITDSGLGSETLLKLREMATVTDGAVGLELVTVSVAGVIKTKIFLILGGLAIQLTGD